MKLTHLLIAGLALSLVHCAKDSKPEMDDGDISVLDLPMQIKPDAKLETEKKAIAEAVKEKKGISFRQVTKLMIERHVKNSKNSSVTTNQIQQFVQSITPAKSLSAAQTKIHYEQKISQQHGGKPLIYNASKSNIVDVHAENRVQCYSGTYLYEIIRRQQKPSAFRAGHEVVIFTYGHVLPGYMVKTADGYSLMGIETTISGGGRISYGLAKNLGSNTKVVDAELFALTEIYADEIANPSEVANAIVQATAKKYGIPLTDGYAPSSSADVNQTRQLNQSIFAFGTADVSPVDKERSVSIDDGKKDDLSFNQGLQVVGVGERADSKLKSMPLSVGFTEARCQPIEGWYQSENKKVIIQISSDGCGFLLVTEAKFVYRYSIEFIGSASHNVIELQLFRRSENGDGMSMMQFNAKVKTIVWHGQKFYPYEGHGDQGDTEVPMKKP